MDIYDRVFREQSPFPEVNGNPGLTFFNGEVGNLSFCTMGTLRIAIIPDIFFRESINPTIPPPGITKRLFLAGTFSGFSVPRYLPFLSFLFSNLIEHFCTLVIFFQENSARLKFADFFPH